MFKDKVALVTGGARGLGASIVKDLAAKGCNVIINYNNSLMEATKLAEELKSYNVEIMTIKCDVSDENSVISMVEKIYSKFGKIDILVNNAAISFDNIIEDKTSKEFMRVLEVNLLGTFLVSKYVGKKMLENKFGKIVNISSTNGIDTGYPESIDYDASKAGVISLTHNLAKLYAPYVNVNCVCPGWMSTEMGLSLGDELIKKEERKILLNRFGKPEEIANVVRFLVSDEASYVNDSIIRVDGGER